jgi:hypothetical protein
MNLADLKASITSQLLCDTFDETVEQIRLFKQSGDMGEQMVGDRMIRNISRDFLVSVKRAKQCVRLWVLYSDDGYVLSGTCMGIDILNCGTAMDLEIRLLF